MFKTSESTAKLDEAMALAQGEMQAAIKDSVNPHFKSRYANLAAVWDAARPALAKYKIAVNQFPQHSTDNRYHVITRVSHAGEFYESLMSVPVTKQDPQGFGSAQTYCLRYTLQAVLGIPADDDDGNEASGRAVAMPAARAPSAKPVASFAVPKISELQLTRLHTLATKSGIGKEQATEIIKSFGYESSKDITVKDYLDICNKIEGKA